MPANFLLLLLLLATPQLPMAQASKNSVEHRAGTYHESLRGAKKAAVVGVPVAFSDGMLFTYLGKEGDRVRVSGDFLRWGGGVEMKRNEFGVFSVFVRMDLKPGTYAYRFLVNNLWINDPKQPLLTDDGFGMRMSSFLLSKATVVYKQSPKKLPNGGLLFFLKDRGYKRVSWVGSANLWNPFADPMRLVDGYWVIEKRLEPNRRFYRFVVDGSTKKLDPKNGMTARANHAEIVSVAPVGLGVPRR